MGWLLTSVLSVVISRKLTKIDPHRTLYVYAALGTEKLNLSVSVGTMCDLKPHGWF